MSAVKYVLEHFYYGQLAGQPQGELQVLASSSGAQPEQIAEAARLALIPPMQGSATGSWALVRGRKALPFTLVQAQVSSSGTVMLHFIILPLEVLRSIGGNLKALLALVEVEMPTFSQAGTKLPALTLNQPELVSAEAQIDDILDLMSYTRNQIDRIELLLSAIVQGVPVVIQHAPPELETRVKFLQGLLALLPPSARFGVTFATHAVESTQTDTQIRFYAGEKLSRETLVYSWTKGKVGGKVVEDEYSRFIISQLRLDPELVSQQTRGLTAVAAWRIKRGEGLAEALGYAAHRLKLDDALQNNQPVESADVSRVLAEDPTLTDALKIAYTRHLLKLALALGDMQHADPIAVMLRQQPELELALQQQFSDAIQEGKPGLVYDAVSRWLGNPLGPVGLRWVELAHRAAVAHAGGLAQARDSKGLHAFLKAVQQANPGVEISRVVPKLIELALPLTVADQELNQTVFLLAVQYLDIDVLRRMLGSQKFSTQLPPSLARIAPVVAGQDAGLVPAGALVQAASVFGEEAQDVILIRLAEAAVRSNRSDIIDTTALSAVIGLLHRPAGVQYSQTLKWIARNMSSDDVLMRLDPPGPTYILQILLHSGGHAELANEMLHQARLLYPGDKQNDYVAMVRRLFAETPIPAEQVPAALKTIGDTGIRSLPLAMAHIGALEGHEWSSALDPVSQDTTRMLYENPAILDVIPPNAIIALLKFHIKRKDSANTIRVAGLLPQVAVREGPRGVNLIGRMYTLMDFDDRVKMAGLELLRRYIRRANDEDARRGIGAYGRELGVKVQQALEATYALRKMLDGTDLQDYAEFLHVTADLLHDTGAAYYDKNRIPSTGALMNNLDSLGGGLNDDERRAIAQEMIGLGKVIVVLGDQAHANQPRELSKHIDGLLKGTAQPNCILDVFYILSGYLTKGKRVTITLERALSKHALGERSANMLLEESKIANSLLRGTVKAFPPDKKLGLTTEALRAEIESLWGDIPLAKQREIVRDLAIDLQRVADLTALIAADGGAKAMEDSGTTRKLEEGKQQPKNALEMYRFVGGYFKARTG